MFCYFLSSKVARVVIEDETATRVTPDQGSENCTSRARLESQELDIKICICIVWSLLIYKAFSFNFLCVCVLVV